MKQEFEYQARQPDDLAPIAKKLLAAHDQSRVFAFFGEMGVGKTTFIKALCRELGVMDTVSSPSFSIVNHYLTQDGAGVYHFDFYRINKLEEVYDLGYEHYFFSGDHCFIEWPGKLGELLPEGFVKVDIEEVGAVRTIRF